MNIKSYHYFVPLSDSVEELSLNQAQLVIDFKSRKIIKNRYDLEFHLITDEEKYELEMYRSKTFKGFLQRIFGKWYVDFKVTMK